MAVSKNCSGRAISFDSTNQYYSTESLSKPLNILRDSEPKTLMENTTNNNKSYSIKTSASDVRNDVKPIISKSFSKQLLYRKSQKNDESIICKTCECADRRCKYEEYLAKRQLELYSEPKNNVKCCLIIDRLKNQICSSIDSKYYNLQDFHLQNADLCIHQERKLYPYSKNDDNYWISQLYGGEYRCYNLKKIRSHKNNEYLKDNESSSIELRLLRELVLQNEEKYKQQEIRKPFFKAIKCLHKSIALVHQPMHKCD